MYRQEKPESSASPRSVRLSAASSCLLPDKRNRRQYQRCQRQPPGSNHQRMGFFLRIADEDRRRRNSQDPKRQHQYRRYRRAFHYPIYFLICQITLPINWRRRSGPNWRLSVLSGCVPKTKISSPSVERCVNLLDHCTVNRMPEDNNIAGFDLAQNEGDFAHHNKIPFEKKR